MNQERKIRILVAKPGLDGHDRGAKVIVFGFRDAGFEVIYTGLHQTPAQIANTAIQEGVDVIGLSILSGAHVSLTRRVIQCLKEKGADEMILIVGGIVPQADVPKLKEMGVAEVFVPGTSIKSIVEFTRAEAGKKRGVNT